MEIIRLWWPPVIVGLVVSVCGVGVAEVSGLTPDPQESSVRSALPVQPEPLPAHIESVEVESATSPVAPRSTPAPASAVTSSPEPEAESETEVEPEPEPEAESSPSPAPKSTRPHPSPAIKLKPKLPAPKLPGLKLPKPKPTPRLPKPAPTVPGQLVDLTNWKLTLPTGDAGSPTEIRQPQLSRFGTPGVFWLDAARKGLAFRAAAGGVTTENSSYPRSELREMFDAGATEAGWSNTSGTHVMSIRQAITAVPSAKPHVVAGQVHDAEDDVIMIRLEGERLFVESDGDEVALLDQNYRLGTRFEVKIIAAANHLHVHYNGIPKLIIARVIDGAYFKAGCYTQSNPSKGDSPDSYGEVVIYALSVRHS